MISSARLLGIIVICGLLPVVFAQSLQPLPIEVALAESSFPSQTPALNFSPDGQLIAYTLQVNRNPDIEANRKTLAPPNAASSLMRGCSIWVADLKSNEVKRLTGDESSSWGLAWSPNGRYLAFYSDRNGAQHLWVWDRSSQQIRQVSDAIVRPLYGFEVPRWTPDGKAILTKVLSRKEVNITKTSATGEFQNKPAGSTVVIYGNLPKSDESNFGSSQPGADLFESSRADLALIELGSGKLQRIASEFEKPRWFSVSPDGSHVAFTNVKGLEAANSQQVLYDLVAVSLSDGRAHVLASNLRQVFGINISWSPDGRFLSYTTSGPLAKGDCYLVELNGGEPRNVTAGWHPSFGHPFRAPLWDDSGKSIYLASSNSLWRLSVSDGRVVELARTPNRTLVEVVSAAVEGRLSSSVTSRFIYLFTFNDETKQTGFVEVDATTGKSRSLIEFSKACGEYPIFKLGSSPNGQQIAYVVQDAQHSEDIWMASPDFRNAKQITHSDRKSVV